LTDLIELKSWLLSFGANALVLEPHSLREGIQSNLRAALHAYEIDSTPIHDDSVRKGKTLKKRR